jgi:hypothetical protein
MVNKLTLTIIANKGVNIAIFGEDRDVLRLRLGPYESFRRTPDAPVTDHFIDVGLLLEFDEEERLNLIEVTPPADVQFQGTALLEKNYHEVIAALREKGIQGVEDSAGMQYIEHGFSLFSSAPGGGDAEVEGVTVFAPGYYD